MTSIKLTEEEKKYLWSKVEYTSKKKMISDWEEKKDTKLAAICDLFKSDKKEFSHEEWNTMLSKLENSFKHSLADKKILKSEVYKSILEKVPNGWSATTKSSNIDAKKKRDSKVKKKNESNTVLNYNEFTNENKNKSK